MNITNYPNGVSSFGNILYGSAQQVDSSGRTYYCDGNSGGDGNDGLSWATAKKTLASVFALSNTDIARSDQKHWARRNTIFIAGDKFVENLTIYPTKADVIGVGSNDAEYGASIQGTHVPDNAAFGTRFIGVNFTVPSAGGDMHTITSSGGAGIGFFNCVFDAHQSTKATGAILATVSHSLRIENCVFKGGFSDAVIELGAGIGNGTIIKNNIIHGANIGIDVNSSFTTADWASYIIGNKFRTTLACINDASSKFQIIDNRGVTLAAKGSSFAGAIVGDVDLSLGNRFTATDANNVHWPAVGTF